MKRFELNVARLSRSLSGSPSSTVRSRTSLPSWSNSISPPSDATKYESLNLAIALVAWCVCQISMALLLIGVSDFCSNGMRSCFSCRSRASASSRSALRLTCHAPASTTINARTISTKIFSLCFPITGSVHSKTSLNGCLALCRSRSGCVTGGVTVRRCAVISVTLRLTLPVYLWRNTVTRLQGIALPHIGRRSRGDSIDNFVSHCFERGQKRESPKVQSKSSGALGFDSTLAQQHEREDQGHYQEGKHDELDREAAEELIRLLLDLRKLSSQHEYTPNGCDQANKQKRFRYQSVLAKRDLHR